MNEDKLRIGLANARSKVNSLAIMGRGHFLLDFSGYVEMEGAMHRMS